MIEFATAGAASTSMINAQTKNRPFWATSTTFLDYMSCQVHLAFVSSPMFLLGERHADDVGV
jgi:hypothetical protein